MILIQSSDERCEDTLAAGMTVDTSLDTDPLLDRATKYREDEEEEKSQEEEEEESHDEEGEESDDEEERDEEENTDIRQRGT